MTTQSPLQPSASVNISEGCVCVTIRDCRPEILELYEKLGESQQSQLCVDAWVFGQRAIANARSEAREAQLAEVGQTLLQDMDRELRTALERQEKALCEFMGKYLDPSDGKLTARLDALVSDEGQIAKIMLQHLGPSGSLAEVLSSQVGKNSALFKLVDPGQASSVVHGLSVELQKVFSSEHDRLGKMLDPAAPDGLAQRLVHGLREELLKADADRDKQFASMTAALNANDESSLISRLFRETQLAGKNVLEAVNPDRPDSPMAAIKSTLESLLTKHIKAQEEATKAREERQGEFERRMLEVAARLENQREADAMSPRGGDTFESAVCTFVEAAVRGGPYVTERSGGRVGIRKNSKKGDQVVRFTAESAFAGAGVVIEAKHEEGYSVPKALAYMEEARENRGAEVGLFVLAANKATPGFGVIARHGRDVLVVWDANDARTDAYLHAALLLALGLACRRGAQGDDGDITALKDVELRIVTEIRRLDDIRGKTKTIRTAADNIDTQLNGAEKKLGVLLKKAKSTLAALEIELDDEVAERASPIGLSQDSLGNAGQALREASGE